MKVFISNLYVKKYITLPLFFMVCYARDALERTRVLTAHSHEHDTTALTACALTLVNHTNEKGTTET